MIKTKTPLRLLRDWAKSSEKYWYPVGHGLGCYGTGYDGWGVQTNQKYVAAMAALAGCGEGMANDLKIDRDHALERCLSALRFSLSSHKSGSGSGTDGRQWGHTWISCLGQERMLGAVQHIRQHLSTQDEADLRRVLTSEAAWLLTDYQRGPEKGITAGRWGNSGHNDPESNGWNGAYLWRVASMYPQHPDATSWRQKALVFLLNTISMDEDAQCEQVVDGKVVKNAHIAANFFPGFSLDHHAYFNVGYMVITASGAAMAHFDLKAMDAARPEALDWHQQEHWQVLRRLIFSDGRLARLGGDSRVRYAYCQEYLLPTLLYAADRLNEKYAAELVQGILHLTCQEVEWNQDGSFYGRRLKDMARSSPYYYTRLESDRACALAQLVIFSGQVDSAPTQLEDGFENSVSGLWADADYGNVMHRSATRLASFSWRALGLAQGMCLPPDRSDFAEWEGNLSPKVRCIGDDGYWSGASRHSRQLVDHTTETFEGGFLTYGQVMEGMFLAVPEGWSGHDQARTQVVFAALPDGHTTLGLHYVRANAGRVYTQELKDLHWCLPNDIYNGFKRHLTTWEGEIELQSPPQVEEEEFLPGNWLHVDGGVGAVIMYGAKGFTVHRTPERRAGKYKSLHVEEICLTCKNGATSHDAHSIMLDSGWAMLSGLDAEATKRFATGNVVVMDNLPKEVRGVRVLGVDQVAYVLLANFGSETQMVHLGAPVSLAGLSALLYVDTGEGLELLK